MKLLPKLLPIVSFAALMPLSSTVYALPWLPGNFVTGVEIGYVDQSANLDSTGFVLGTPLVGTHSEKVSDNGTIYGGLIGYQFICRNWLFGLEANANMGHYGKAKNFLVPALNGGTITDAKANVWFDRGTAYGVSARVGYQIPSCFTMTPYLRVGGEGSRDSLSVTYLYSNSGAPNHDHFEEKQSHWTWLFGAGLEVPLFSKKTSLRFEYDYLAARSFEFKDTVAPVLVTHHYNPHAHVGKVQWVWNFD